MLKGETIEETQRAFCHFRKRQELGHENLGDKRIKNGPQLGPVLSCLASPANFIYGRVLAKVLSHVTIMPVLLRPENNFLGQVIGNASEGKYNTVNNSSSGEVSF